MSLYLDFHVLGGSLVFRVLLPHRPIQRQVAKYFLDAMYMDGRKRKQKDVQGRARTHKDVQ